MLGRLERPVHGQRLYSPGSFDLVIIDEAHRSVYQRYGALLEYFDGLLLGLTATPRDEVDRDTYALFHLAGGDPTFSYELEDAVRDGHLVPPKGKRVPSASCSRASPTTSSAPRSRPSTRPSSPTTTASCPARSTPPRSTAGSSTRTPSTRPSSS
jgi:superfamily II DNA or RNA helicase